MNVPVAESTAGGVVLDDDEKSTGRLPDTQKQVWSFYHFLSIALPV